MFVTFEVLEASSGGFIWVVCIISSCSLGCGSAELVLGSYLVFCCTLLVTPYLVIGEESWGLAHWWLLHWNLSVGWLVTSYWWLCPGWLGWVWPWVCLLSDSSWFWHVENLAWLLSRCIRCLWLIIARMWLAGEWTGCVVSWPVVCLVVGSRLSCCTWWGALAGGCKMHWMQLSRCC